MTTWKGCGMPTIVHLTDLHLDEWLNNLEIALGFEELREITADVVLIGGDNGMPDDVARTVGEVRERWPSCSVGWVMGNHELWHQRYDILWKQPSPEGAVYLEERNLETPSCTVVGSYGHYDYSGGDPEIPVEDYEAYRHGGLGWNDWLIDRRGKTNPEIAAEVAHRFERRYDAALARGRPVIVVTHTLPFVELCGWPRSFYGAYGTNSLLGKIILARDPKPAALFCGHTHKPLRTEVFGFPMINTGSDYEEVRVTVWEL
ncbi:Calcineurin-like phosphoesterase [Planctomycetes bacterium Pan216]|uniref:Calcineurin-like phosphoesterase n=1 Tax=Kolteria novifilia TaxID=2527975 RepID=A0A518AWU8_9BACT|nr:Calcineurin-like phosphoesterase [Planctomycetes bacterium Pan216]